MRIVIYAVVLNFSFYTRVILFFFVLALAILLRFLAFVSSSLPALLQQEGGVEGEEADDKHRVR